MAEPMPAALQGPVRAALAMLAHRETGCVTINVKDGVIVTWDKLEKHAA